MGSPVRVVPRPGLNRDSTVAHEPGRGAGPRGCKCVQLTTVCAALYKLATSVHTPSAPACECGCSGAQDRHLTKAQPRSHKLPSRPPCSEEHSHCLSRGPHSAPAEACSTAWHLQVTPSATRRPPIDLDLCGGVGGEVEGGTKGCAGLGSVRGHGPLKDSRWQCWSGTWVQLVETGHLRGKQAL